ncbi:hypothetical protein [Shewanella pneumatophori]|uniref:Lipoprotein n=1 Tax=Shewanella pneumatophori TaxID=314092 RepID=A0A9X1Z9Q6_9GAMM|nr:hypothetical protein [Shewanella pneumatophori]MCL1138269.1 hypothetical protein [Shewanella pneumatophori]
MKLRIKNVLILAATLSVLSGCGDKTSGMACLGTNNDSLVEGMQDICKAGDAVATKHPAYFCDFNYAIAYNDYNSAMCIYNGAQKKERASKN